MLKQHSFLERTLKASVATALAGTLSAAFAQSAEPTSSFPTAEDFLAAQGLDPQLVKKLTGQTGTVRIFTPEGLSALTARILKAIPNDPSVHYTNYLTSLVDRLERIKSRQDLPSSYRMYDLERGWLNFRFREFEDPSTECFVAPASDALTAKKIVSILSGISADHLDDVTVPLDTLKKLILLHEIRHCDPIDLSDVYAASEATADLAGLENLNDPALSLLLLQARASGKFAGSHSTSLYIDAMMKGVKPDISSLWGAENQLSEKTDRFRLLYQDELSGMPRFLATAHAIRYVLVYQNDTLTPTAKHRAVMFLKGVQAIAPTIVSSEFGTDLIPATAAGNPLAERAFTIASSALDPNIHPDTAKSYYNMLRDFIYVENGRSPDDNLHDFHLTRKRMDMITRQVKILELREAHSSLRFSFFWNKMNQASPERKLEAHKAMQKIAQELAGLGYSLDDEKTFALIGSSKKEFHDNLKYAECLVRKNDRPDCRP